MVSSVRSGTSATTDAATADSWLHPCARVQRRLLAQGPGLGWAVADHTRTDPVESTLSMAVTKRAVSPTRLFPRRSR